MNDHWSVLRSLEYQFNELVYWLTHLPWTNWLWWGLNVLIVLALLGLFALVVRAIRSRSKR